MEEDFERGPLWMRFAFYGAAAFNIVGILFMSRLLTADLGQWDPLFGVWGCVMVVVWGLAYLSAAARPYALPWLAGAFMVEKAIYAIHWGVWLAGSEVTLEAMAEADPLAASFFGSYGLGDAAFGVFFGYVWLSGLFVRAGR